MSKKKDKLYIIILYRDNSYKMISFKKLYKVDLSNDKIKYILIPYLDFKGVYIPIRPTTLYKFYKAEVKIYYQLFFFEYEEMRGDSFSVDEYSNECYNIITLINSLYNVYKFRAISILINDAKEERMKDGIDFLNWTIYPRRIQVIFKDSNNQIIHEIDSEDMGDYAEEDPTTFINPPPHYYGEDRFECLSEIFFTPCETQKNGNTALQNLPIGIKLSDNDWYKIKKPGIELRDSDYFFYNLPDFGCYIYLPYNVYTNLFNIHSFEVQIIGGENYSVTSGEDINQKYNYVSYLKSRRYNQIPTIVEKREFLDAYLNDDLIDIYGFNMYIKSSSTFLIAEIFFPTILSYMTYIVDVKLMESTNIVDKIIVITKDSSYKNPIILVEEEVTQETLIDAFLSIINETN